ncbi:glycosyltransferase family 2 protein [Limosilactobacillus sp. STM2_1]|uniref:Glycosyltransferase family 2 protein n=1 Tax=Limosilactobacillus rudii TaxID=2759755 RepID=A0A7W3UKQ6_9LACO|nr:glycosyltransferase family 2 protein [Limosilactobacillus rudii]MBB1080291.1 glycosyltransferase family 2 protein [Limosilactobacillus rudii]MBB1096805.1 glycosyltransferase family 2 protein [Limosilactobacillus rudii]MCD7133702.1 glycosyltransferase [Limosilactobacillus rudii]
MINDITVSVIIPVYNVKKYLKKCVTSLVKQTYNKFEIILIDDGSTDGSGELCDTFAQRSNIIEVYHKKNGGLSDARNFGVKKAKYENIIFIDSDDYVDPDYVEYLVKLKRKYDSDLTISGYITESINGSVNNTVVSPIEITCSSKKAFQYLCYGKTIPIMAWGKLYSRQSLLKYPFPVGMLNEDVGTTYKLILNSGKVAIGNKASYHYIQRPGSILHSDNGEEFFYGVIAAAEIVQVAKKRLKDRKSIFAAYGRFIIEAIGLLHRSSVNKSVYLRSTQLVKEKSNVNIFLMLFNNNLTISKRIQFIFFFLSPKLYRLVYLHSKRRSDD